MGLTSGCDSDPFGVRKATVLEPYELQRSEIEPYYYYLVDGKNSYAYGALESTVGKIGWNNQYILVWQTADGLKPGWRIINSTEEIVGEYMSEENALSDPRVSGVTILSPDDAWTKLKQ